MNRYFKRRVNYRKARESFLICCDGDTEAIYFNNFHVPKKIIPVGSQMLELVEKTANIRTKLLQKGETFDQCWCVTDIDSTKKTKIDQTFKTAEQYGIKIAYSNVSFELWYVLHFCYLQSALGTSQLQSKLSKHIGKKYDKIDRSLYKMLYNNQQKAIINASRLISNLQSGVCPNPSTTVHILVNELNKFSI